MRAGELFAGAGGLAMSVSEVFGATTEWVAGLCPTRWEADIAARGLTAFREFSTRGVAA